MSKSLKYRLVHLLRKLLGLRGSDDFDWLVYDHKYQNELDLLERQYTLQLASGDAAFNGSALTLREGLAKPLHENHHALYETITRLAPSSVCEFGCGGGDHLHNLGVLLPGVELHGLDRGRGQLAILQRRNPDTAGCARLQDITAALPADAPKVELAYTQAVLMHIQTGDAHLRGLRNMFQVATEAVVLMENWTRHPFLEDVRTLEQRGDIPWDGVHVHYRPSTPPGAPQVMIISRTPLQHFPALPDYTLLTDPMA